MFLNDHVENIVEFALRFFRRAANRVAAVNGRNVGDITPVVVPMTDDMIIEERFHVGNLTHEPGERKWKDALVEPVLRLVARRAIRFDEEADFHKLMYVFLIPRSSRLQRKLSNTL